MAKGGKPLKMRLHDGPVLPQSNLHNINELADRLPISMELLRQKGAGDETGLLSDAAGPTTSSGNGRNGHVAQGLLY